jgi:cobalt/nickel transport system permease protein
VLLGVGMHIFDGYIDLPTAVVMFAVSIVFLAVAWKKVKADYPQSFVALLAISSAFVFAAQMLNFPILLGTSGHLVGGTFLAILLGPWAGMLSMTIILLMQAFFFADGGVIAFGANVFNMAIIGALSYFVVRFLARSSKNPKRFAPSVFLASWLSVVIGSLAAGIEMGISPAYADAGGIAVTVPIMLFYHVFIGLGEGAITTTLVMSLQRLQPAIMNGLSIMKGKIK